MKKLLTAAAGLFVILFILSPMAFAASAEQALEKCKTQADAEEVADTDLKTWITNCMTDEGVSTADAKPLIDEEFGSENQEGAKTTTY